MKPSTLRRAFILLYSEVIDLNVNFIQKHLTETSKVMWTKYLGALLTHGPRAPWAAVPLHQKPEEKALPPACPTTPY